MRKRWVSANIVNSVHAAAGGRRDSRASADDVSVLSHVDLFTREQSAAALMPARGSLLAVCSKNTPRHRCSPEAAAGVSTIYQPAEEPHRVLSEQMAQH